MGGWVLIKLKHILNVGQKKWSEVPQSHVLPKMLGFSLPKGEKWPNDQKSNQIIKKN